MNKRSLYISLAILSATVLISLFFRGLSDPDEGRYAQIPREMVDSGNWLEMRIFGLRYYEKPPLTYWLTAPAIRWIGAYDWAVRIPLLIPVAGIAFLLFRLAGTRWKSPEGTGAALIAFTTGGLLFDICALTTDAFLTFWFAVTCTTLYLAFRREASTNEHRFYLLLATLSAACGFFTKGAIAFILPAGILFFWLLWEKRLRSLFRLSVLAASVLFMLLIIPLLWLLEKHNPGFLKQFIFEEHLARFTGTRAAGGHSEPFYFFITLLIPILLPWGLFLFRAGRIVVVNRVFKTDSLSRFLWVWFLLVLVFFSASTGKLLSYIIPALPPIALLIGRWGIMEPVQDSKADRWLWRAGCFGSFAFAAAILIIWPIAYFQWIPKDVFRLSGVTLLLMLPLAAVLFLVARQGRVGTFQGLFLLNCMSLLTMTLMLSPLAGKDFNLFVNRNHSIVYKQLATMLKPEDEMIVFWDYRPSLLFYTGRTYIPFQNINELSYGLALERRNKVEIETLDQLHRILRKIHGRALALVDPEDYEKKFLRLDLSFDPKPLLKNPRTLVLELKKQ